MSAASQKKERLQLRVLAAACCLVLAGGAVARCGGSAEVSEAEAKRIASAALDAAENDPIVREYRSKAKFIEREAMDIASSGGSAMTPMGQAYGDTARRLMAGNRMSDAAERRFKAAKRMLDVARAGLSDADRDRVEQGFPQFLDENLGPREIWELLGREKR